jgi:hypothetical protein
MGKNSLDWAPPPKFATKANGKPAKVTLDPVTYVALLVKANLTDPNLWPPGMQEGAAALARVRAIEKHCIAKHGHFDWEKLSRKLQDEYDSKCALLDQLQDTGERILLRDLLRQEGQAAP